MFILPLYYFPLSVLPAMEQDFSVDFILFNQFNSGIIIIFIIMITVTFYIDSSVIAICLHDTCLFLLMLLTVCCLCFFMLT